MYICWGGGGLEVLLHNPPLPLKETKTTVVPTERDDVTFCLQLLSKTLTCIVCLHLPETYEYSMTFLPIFGNLRKMRPFDWGTISFYEWKNNTIPRI